MMKPMPSRQAERRIGLAVERCGTAPAACASPTAACSRQRRGRGTAQRTRRRARLSGRPPPVLSASARATTPAASMINGERRRSGDAAGGRCPDGRSPCARAAPGRGSARCGRWTRGNAAIATASSGMNIRAASSMLMSGKFSSAEFRGASGRCRWRRRSRRDHQASRLPQRPQARATCGLQRGHDGKPRGLADRHEPHRDRDLAVHGGGEIADERVAERDAVRGRDGADGDRIGAGRGQRRPSAGQAGRGYGEGTRRSGWFPPCRSADGVRARQRSARDARSSAWPDAR